MIYNVRLTELGDRKLALDYLENLKANSSNLTVVDIGACGNPWTKDYITHVVDIVKFPSSIKQFQGNISDVDVWNEVLSYIKEHGKFDFAVCTHTLEDISCSPIVCNMLTRIAKEGFIAIPSKYIELDKPENVWRGFIHHRWIYDIKDGQFIGYPKQSFLEHMKWIDDWVQQNPKTGREELQFFWKDEIKLHVINNDYLGPTWFDVIQFYRKLTSE